MPIRATARFYHPPNLGKYDLVVTCIRGLQPRDEMSHLESEELDLDPATLERLIRKGDVRLVEMRDLTGLHPDMEEPHLAVGGRIEGGVLRAFWPSYAGADDDDREYAYFVNAPVSVLPQFTRSLRALLVAMGDDGARTQLLRTMGRRERADGQ